MSDNTARPIAHAQSVSAEELRQVPVFRHFPEDLLQGVASVTALISYPDGHEILRQDQLNTHLYFLRQGRVAVYVDGGLVAHLKRPGDLIGEMSVITSKPCTATIIADGSCELFVLNSDDLKDFEGGNTDRFQNTIYRIYSIMLSDKLRLTNQKAKHFEENNKRLAEAQEQLRAINAELEIKVEQRTAALRQRTEDLWATNQKLEQQHAEVTASHKRLEELYSTRDVTFRKLEDLYANHLDPLSKTLHHLESTSEGNVHNEIVQVSRQVEEVMKMLEPITQLYSTELAMRAKKVLLADTQKKQQIVAKLALGGTGVELDIVSSLEEGQAKLSEKSYDVLFVDGPLLKLSEEAVKKSPNTRVVFMTSESIPDYLPRLKAHSFMPNIVSRDEEDRTFTIKNIMTTVGKLASQDIFGLEKYLSWGVDIQERSVQSSTQRNQLIEEMDEYFARLGVRRSNRDRLRQVLEELLMNAIYDAPVDEQGISLYNHLPRTTSVDLKPEHYGRLKYATDGVLVALSVEDPFGSLNGETILTYLETCYGGREGELNRQKGGAGRGLYQIVESSDLVVFNLRPRKRTEVVVLFNVDPRQGGDKNPSFHLFVK